MGADNLPTVARWGTTHPSAPLIVALHGNGTSEHSMIEIAPWLPHGPVAYVAVRAPLLLGSGYSWYPDGPDGGPDPAGLATTCEWLLDWLDTEGDPERPVLLLAFRGGVTAAGALLLTAPHRFAGAVLLYGALPFDAGIPLPRGGLAGLPVFLARGDDDARTSTRLLDRTSAWLGAESGAPLWELRVPGGTQLAGEVVGAAGTWLTGRLGHVHAHGENPLPDGAEPHWPELGRRLPPRAGEPPAVTPRIPQQQASQRAPEHLHAALWDRIRTLDAVSTAPAPVGVPGTRSLLLDRTRATGPDTAFLLPAHGEFAHLHPQADGALHVALPDALAYDALAKGWALAHPLAGLRVSNGAVLVPGPRDEAELEIVVGIVAASHRYALGDDRPTDPPFGVAEPRN